MAPPQFYTRTVYEHPPGFGPAETAEEDDSGPEIQQHDGVRMVEEPLDPQSHKASSKQGEPRQGRGEEGRKGMNEMRRRGNG